MLKSLAKIIVIIYIEIFVFCVSAQTSFLTPHYTKFGLASSPVILTHVHLNNGKLKTVSLKKIYLSKAERDSLSNNIRYILNQANQLKGQANDVPSSKFLGMNNIPVLDQGPWRTCVTFANTAAIDAMYHLQSTTMASQVCSIQLERTLEPTPPPGVPSPAAWLFGGPNAQDFLGYIAKYGYVDMSYQTLYGCGGLKQYPLKDERDPKQFGQAMPINEFTAVSHKQFSNNDWLTLYSAPTHRRTPPSPSVAIQLLNNVKKAISSGSRVTIAMMGFNLGTIGAMGSYNKITNDGYVLSQQVIEDIAKGANSFAHEVIIDGYDDNACITYSENQVTKKQCGVLHIRNSLGTNIGDHGDFYMTYDYFKALTLDATEISKNARIKDAALRVY